MASVLQTIVEKKHYKFIDTVDTWQEAVKLSTESLIADGSVSEDYYQQIVNCITKYGPYVVYDDYVAMPHSQENAEGVYKTGIGFMRVKEPVDFGPDEDGEHKLAKLFFTIASCNPDEHIDNITQLMGIFQNSPLLHALAEADTPEDILRAEAEHPAEEE